MWGGTRSLSKLLQNFSLRPADHKGKKSVRALVDTSTMADQAAVVEEGVSPGQNPLVAVTFQKNIHRNQKYLEAEPKALGVTQIGLSVFQIVCLVVFLAKGLSHIGTDIPFFIASLLVVIAGCLAVAAQNLHLPTLKACLGMQIVGSVASLFNMICSLVKMNDTPPFCWHYYYDNSTLRIGEICHNIESTRAHFFAEAVLIQAVLLAISVTLAAYCCKVVNCCAAASKMAVITVHTPAVQQ